MNFDDTYYTIDIPADAKLIRFREVPEEGASGSEENGTSTPGIYHIDIPEDAKLITYKVLPDENSAENTGGGEDDSLRIDISKDSNLIPLDACTVHKIPRKRVEDRPPQNGDDSAVAVLAQCLQHLSEERCRAKRLTEDYLFRKLMEHFKFGSFGGAIYVRSDEVYQLVTQRSLSTLLLSVLTQQEKSCFRMQSMQGVFARLTHDPEVAGNALVIPEGRALFLNGAWDIVKRKRVKVKDNELYPFRVQANYIPELAGDGKYLRKFLSTASAGDCEVADRIMVMTGYSLVCGFSKIIWVAGCAPNSGKSIWGRWLTEIIGENFVAAVPPQDMGNHFVIAQLAGAPVNLSLDISKRHWSDTVASFLKANSGEDKTVFNQKFQNATSQRFLCKHLFASNYPIKLQSYDRALWNRIQIAPFVVSTAPENQDRKLLEHLLQERDEIVALAMEAIRRVILNNWQLPPCAVADEMKNAWIGWQIGADEFLSAFCEVEEGAFTASREMYRQYVQYCEQRDFPVAEETGFVLHVKKAFPQQEKKKIKINGLQRNGFCGLKLKTK